MRSSGRIKLILLLVIYCLLIIALFQIERNAFSSLITIYSLSFIVYLFILSAKRSTLKQLWIVFLIGSCLGFFFDPKLSTDYYRFLWDGSIQHLGIDPLAFKPSQLMMRSDFQESAYLNELYQGMGELSAGNYSCYPSMKQLIFFCSSLSHSIGINMLILKTWNLLITIGGAYFLINCLRLLQLDEKRAFWLLLNPLWMLEVSSNLHFEGIMISLLAAAFYLLLRKRLSASAFLLACAINVKLLPLIVLPFLWRFLGIQRALAYYTYVFFFTFILGVSYIHPSNYLLFSESLVLYFKNFEFNSSVFYYYIQYGRWTDGWNKIRYIGPRLARYTLMILSVLALYGEFTEWRVLFRRLLFAFVIYFMFSSTVHPWYLLTPLFISLFTELSTMVIWSLFVMLSYYYYSAEGSGDTTLRTLIGIEYLVVIGTLLYEISFRRPVLKSFQRSF